MIDYDRVINAIADLSYILVHFESAYTDDKATLNSVLETLIDIRDAMELEDDT